MEVYVAHRSPFCKHCECDDEMVYPSPSRGSYIGRVLNVEYAACLSAGFIALFTPVVFEIR